MFNAERRNLWFARDLQISGVLAIRSGTPIAFHIYDDYHTDTRRRKKRVSFWGELFDFG